MAAGFRTIVESLPRRVPAKASSWAAGCSGGYEQSPVWKDRWLVGAVFARVSAFGKKAVQLCCLLSDPSFKRASEKLILSTNVCNTVLGLFRRDWQKMHLGVPGICASN